MANALLVVCLVSIFSVTNALVCYDCWYVKLESAVNGTGPIECVDFSNPLKLGRMLCDVANGDNGTHFAHCGKFDASTETDQIVRRGCILWDEKVKNGTKEGVKRTINGTEYVGQDWACDSNDCNSANGIVMFAMLPALSIGFAIVLGQLQLLS